MLWSFLLENGFYQIPSDHTVRILVTFKYQDKVQFPYFQQNTIEGRIAFFPAVGRLDCQSTYIDHQGFWQMDGFGLLAVYKSDWIHFGGKFKENRYFNTVTAEPPDVHFNIFLAPFQK